MIVTPIFKFRTLGEIFMQGTPGKSFIQDIRGDEGYLNPSANFAIGYPTPNFQ